MRSVSERLKSPSTKVMMKKASREIIRPIIEAIIVCLALSTLDLSPPEVIQRIPPQIRKKSAIIAAATKRIVIILEIRLPILFALILQRPEKFVPFVVPRGHGSTLTAKAGRAIPKYVAPVARATDVLVSSLFIFFL